MNAVSRRNSGPARCRKPAAPPRAGAYKQKFPTLLQSAGRSANRTTKSCNLDCRCGQSGVDHAGRMAPTATRRGQSLTTKEGSRQVSSDLYRNKTLITGSRWYRFEGRSKPSSIPESRHGDRAARDGARTGPPSDARPQGLGTASSPGSPRIGDASGRRRAPGPVRAAGASGAGAPRAAW
jgi:hypothetical protein